MAMCDAPEVLVIRLARPENLAELAPRSRALNAHEDIALDPVIHEAALDQLLRTPAIGCAWLIERDGAVIGYAITTYGYDLEFNGRDATLTELWIDPEARGGGAGGEVLALLEPEMRALGVHALHLQVRPENPAFRLYQRSGFIASPRTVMTRRL